MSALKLKSSEKEKCLIISGNPKILRELIEKIDSAMLLQDNNTISAFDFNGKETKIQFEMTL